MDSNHIQKFSIICLTIINVILMPCFLLLCALSYKYRTLICSFKLLLRKDLGPILCPQSTGYARYNIETDPNPNIIINMKINGKLDLDRLQAKIIKHLILGKNQHGELIYPQFQMYPVHWMGFYFWKSVNQFEIRNHISSITLQNGQSVDIEFEKSFGGKTYKNGESPWKILIVRSENDSYYHILLKFHHCLADGNSIFMSFIKCVDNPTPPYISKDNLAQSENILRKIWRYFIFPFRACYEYAKFTTTTISKSFLLDNMNQQRFELNTRIISKSSPLKFSRIKDLSIRHGFPVSVIIMAAFSGGIHKFLRRRGKNSTSLRCTMPLPNPVGLSEELTNDYVTVIYPLPIGEMEPLSRLQSCEKRINKLKICSQTELPAVIPKLFGVIPFLPRPNIFSQVELGLSIYPGPRETLFIDAHPITEMSYFLYGILDVVMSTLTYSDDFVFIITGAVFAFKDESDIQLLVKDIQDEFKTFEDMSLECPPKLYKLD